MSEPQKTRSRARGRSSGRARGVPAPPSANLLAQQQHQQYQQQPGPSYQQQPQQQAQQQQAQQQQPPQQQPRASARGRGQVVKPTTPQQQIPQQALPQQQPSREEEGAYGVDPGVEQLAGAFRGLAMGEAKPGQALRRGAVRGRCEVVPPPRTRSPTMSIKRGKDGRKIEVITNHFRLIKKTDWSLYQYRVDFSPEEERTKVRKALLRDHKDTLGEAYMFDGSMLFTIQRLHPDKFEVFSERQPDQTKIRITIKFTNELALGDYQYIQLYNIILRHCIDALKFQLVGREYFDPTLSARLKNFKLEIWPGFSTSILQHEDHIMLGIDVSHKVLRTDTAYDYYDDCKKRFGSDYITFFNNGILGNVVFTYYNNKPYRVDDIDHSSDPSSTFTRGNTEISYIDYYMEKYQIRLKYKKQPLLISRPKARDIRGGRRQNIILIPELCHMTGLSDEMRGNFTLMKAVADRTRIAPADRIASYYNFMDRMGKSQEVQNKLNIWNIKFSPRLEYIDARQLDAEALHTGNKQIITNHGGDWTRSLRDHSLLLPVKLERWTVVIAKHAAIDKQNRNPVEVFLNELRKMANGLRFEIIRPNIIYLNDDKIGTYMNAIDKEIHRGSVQMIMAIIHIGRNDVYGAIKKRCGADFAVPSQVIATKTLQHKNLASVCTKVAIQMNCKLGGSPWFTPIPFKVDGDKVSATMVIGFDVCHETKKQGESVGAMVASVDYYFSKYYSAISKHILGEELSNSIANHVIHAVFRYSEVNGCLPPRIIMYRDGVGESNIKYVLDHEVSTIVSRLNHTFANHNFKMAFVIVSKRIQTRIFIADGKNALNPQPGTIVDDVITQPEKYDFFLVSQSVRQGTVTPTNYNVVYDTLKLSPSQLQRATYKMTHLYYNCSSTVRVPAQVQYAHKLAFLVGQVTRTPPHVEMNNFLHFL